MVKTTQIAMKPTTRPEQIFLWINKRRTWNCTWYSQLEWDLDEVNNWGSIEMKNEIHVKNMIPFKNNWKKNTPKINIIFILFDKWIVDNLVHQKRGLFWVLIMPLFEWENNNKIWKWGILFLIEQYYIIM